MPDTRGTILSDKNILDREIIMVMEKRAHHMFSMIKMTIPGTMMARDTPDGIQIT